MFETLTDMIGKTAQAGFFKIDAATAVAVQLAAIAVQWYDYLVWLKSTMAALATNKTSEGFIDFDILMFLKNCVHIFC